jgi:two-component system cell cycle response regulator DivK
VEFKVLIIEDDENVRNVLQDMIESKNYNAASANNGLEGVELARTYQPDVVLMDIEMPVMNGYEALKAIRSDPALRHLPVIAVTGCIQPREAHAMLAKGFDHCIIKPCTVEQIAAILSGYRKDMANVKNA